MIEIPCNLSEGQELTVHYPGLQAHFDVQGEA